MRSGRQALQGLASEKVVCILASLRKGGVGSPEVEGSWFRHRCLNVALAAAGHCQLMRQSDVLSSRSEKEQSRLPPPQPGCC